ncbi:DUF4231 domain-containing protein [Streptacidiphilus sp. EB129]|uniref:DUF4231 domain-containing protein n=1 Tax=Streptacidiphilus sp. EB129 TaxID=3156262 RepID=UPI0035160186
MVRQYPPGHRERELLPEPFWAADRASLDGQGQSIRWYVGQITMLLIAAAVGIPNIHAKGLNLSPVLSLLAFVGAWYFWDRLRAERPQARWYEGRAAAESVKTLAWKYVVRARPFAGEAESASADEAYTSQMAEVFQAFRDSPVIPSGSKPEITREMRRLRAAPLAVRRDLYLQDRVRAQRTWYQTRADACDNETAKWQLIAVASIIVGIGFALLQIFDVFSLHFLGLFTTMAASVTAWTQLKQFGPLASAYRLAGTELDMIEVQLGRLDPNLPNAEESWSRLSRDAEDAVSREHTIWRARRDRRV